MSFVRSLSCTNKSLKIIHVLYVIQKIRMQCIHGFSGTQKQAINFTKWPLSKVEHMWDMSIICCMYVLYGKQSVCKFIRTFKSRDVQVVVTVEF